MATIDQFDDLYRFAKAIPPQEFTKLSVDEIYDRWREDKVFDEDTHAIQEALDSYDRGERGRPVEEFLADFRQKRAALGDTMETSE